MKLPGSSPLAVPRLFLRDPGWRVGIKATSEREFCYSVNPGEEGYHRLAEGEIFLFREDEKLCLPCAGRLGLLEDQPRHLRDPVHPVPVSGSGVPDPGYDLGPPPG